MRACCSLVAVQGLSTNHRKTVIKAGFDPVFGARPLKRAIQQRIGNPLSKLLLEGRFLPKSVTPVDVDTIRAPGQFSFERVVH